jgi:O-succinylbenzoic acid--CoA ligase
MELDKFPDSIRAGLDFCKKWLEGKEAFEQQTSGSTGKPKILSITRIRMIESALATQRFFKTNPQSHLLCCLDTRYIAGKMMLVRAMVWDSPIRLVEPSSNPIENLNEDEQMDFVAMVPLQVQAALNDQTCIIKLKAIRNIIIGGAPISENLKAELIESNIYAFQTYGMTETVSHVALAKIDHNFLKYSVLPGVKIGTDNRGALWIESPMSGVDHIQTNDLVKLLTETDFKWLGRADFVINSGGVKIHPEQLEIKISNRINEFYPNSAFFFSSKEDEKLGEKLVLFIESENFNTEKLLNFKNSLHGSLSKFEIPKAVYILKQFTRTKSFKIDRLKTAKL